MGVLDVRGTHGSGKSWLVHQLLESQTHKELRDGKRILGYHLPTLDVAVVGKYTTACGGCDGVGSADEVVRRVRTFANDYRHVVLEGILVAHTFQRYSDLAFEMSDYGYTFFFLDTPLDVCIERVQSRRAAKGQKALESTHNIEHDHKQIWTNVRTKMKKAGHKVIELPYQNPRGLFLKELG
jgi:predicted kinase